MKLNEFNEGDRVELHPATDLWMRGARFGTVLHVGRNHLTVKLDKIANKVRVHPEFAQRVVEG